MESRVKPPESITNTMIGEIQLPFVPHNVDIRDLLPDGSLMSDEDCQKFIERIDLLRQEETHHFKKYARRFTKKALESKYGAIVFADNYFAIYYGIHRGKELGEGGFGYAKLVWDLKKKEWAVLKIAGVNSESQEFKILKKVGLGIGYLERTVDINSKFVRYQRERNKTTWALNQANLVMKLAPGASLAVLKEDQTISVEKWFHIFSMLFCEYQKLANKKIVHCDLKPTNIFFDIVQDVITILDFGGSKKKHIFKGAKGNLMGTGPFMAPELDPERNQSKYHYTVASDIFALGVTLYDILALEFFESSKIKDFLLFERTKKFCLTLLSYKPSDRPSCESCIQFIETERLSMQNLVTKPIRKIAIFSLEEFLQFKEAALAQKKSPPKIQLEKSISLEAKIESPPKRNFFLSIIDYLSNAISSTTHSSISIENNTDVNEIVPDVIVSDVYDDVIQPDLFFSVLLKFDEVWFLDSQQRNNKDYIILQREFQEKKIRLGTRCFISSNISDQMLDELFLKISDKHYSRSNKFFFVTAMDIKSNDSVHVIGLNKSKEYLNADSYNEEIKAIAQKDVSEEYYKILDSLSLLQNACLLGSIQYLLITNKIKDFTKKFSENNLSQDYVIKALSELKEQLSKYDDNQNSHHHFRGHSVSLFKRKTEQIQNPVDEIQQEIRQWIKGYSL